MVQSFLNEGGLKVYGAVVCYGRGLLHDGSHALDLMRWFFGPMISAFRTHYIHQTGFDLSYGFVAKYERCPIVSFIPVNSLDYGIFEIEILHSKGQHYLKQNGTKLEARLTTTGDQWGDYPVLGPDRTGIYTHLTKGMQLLYANVGDYLFGTAQPFCTIDDAQAMWADYKMVVTGEKL